MTKLNRNRLIIVLLAGIASATASGIVNASASQVFQCPSPETMFSAVQASGLTTALQMHRAIGQFVIVRNKSGVDAQWQIVSGAKLDDNPPHMDHPVSFDSGYMQTLYPSILNREPTDVCAYNVRNRFGEEGFLGTIYLRPVPSVPHQEQQPEHIG